MRRRSFRGLLYQKSAGLIRELRESEQLSPNLSAKAILSDAAAELVRAASSVRDRLRLEEAPYDVVLSGGTFVAVPSLEADVARRLETPHARVRKLAEEPAMGAVKLAIEALGAPAASAPAP